MSDALHVTDAHFRNAETVPALDPNSNSNSGVLSSPRSSVQPEVRVRSSIACARCRRSKVRCVNNGVNTTCKSCKSTGRECIYPLPAITGAGGRRDGTTAASGRGRGESPTSARRQNRLKRPAIALESSSGTKDSSKAFVEALDPTVLTPQVWTELFEIFQLHFSTDLPFLHPPTFQKPLRKSALPPQSPGKQGPNAPLMPVASPILLLSFLALTSRFHSTLIRLHSPPDASRLRRPLAAAEYYASAAKQKLSGSYTDEKGRPNLESTQALLMLGLHEWSMCRGAQAWILIGVAVRTAQILGLQFEQELDDQPMVSSAVLNMEAQHMGIDQERATLRNFANKNNSSTDQEIRRRTFWSCFIMDRYLSCGRFRPQMLDVKDLKIQLPSSDRAFLFGEKVHTNMLGEDAGCPGSQTDRHGSFQGSFQSPTQNRPAPENRRNDTETGRWEIGADEGILSRFIKTLDLYGRIMKWSCAGGRRQERYPPWDPKCKFYELRCLLSSLKDGLPRDLALSQANVSAHITSRTSTPYTLMHTLFALCSIILHREYVPFVPIRCSKPQGPLDPPVFSPDEHRIPPGFWEESAREIFKSARELIDLVRICQEWEVSVETPIMGFATYTAAFCGVYAINFPWMDPDGFMCKRSSHPMHGSSVTDHGGAESARKALETVGQMRERLRMADGWFKTIKRSHMYFVRIKKDFKRNSRALETGSADSSESYRQLSLREGGVGGGLEEYKLIEKVMKEFGTLEDEDVDMMDTDNDMRVTLDEGSDTGSGVKSEIGLNEGPPDHASGRQEGWSAVNSATIVTSLHGSQASYPGSDGGGPPSMNPSGYPYERQPYIPPHQFPDHRHRPTPQAAIASQSSSQQAAWTAADGRESWLNNLDTRFGGEDIAAFAAGNDWEEFSSLGGWLGNVWGGVPTSAAGTL